MASPFRRARFALLFLAVLVVAGVLRGERYIERGDVRLDALRLLFTLPLGLLGAGAVLRVGERWSRARLGAVVLGILAAAVFGSGWLLAIVPASQILTRVTIPALLMWSVIIGGAFGLMLYSLERDASEEDSAIHDSPAADQHRDREQPG